MIIIFTDEHGNVSNFVRLLNAIFLTENLKQHVDTNKYFSFQFRKMDL